MQLSIVTTLYYSRQTISQFITRSVATASALGIESYEIVIVNDGCPENSHELLSSPEFASLPICLIDLSRNHGHHKALFVGLSFSTGDSVFLIDSDLEEQPEWLNQFLPLLQSSGADVVYGIQKIRRGAHLSLRRLSGQFSYYFVNLMSEIKHPPNLVTARVMTRRYVDALLLFRERNFIISCLWDLAGFTQLPLEVTKTNSSPSTYAISKRVNLFIDLIVSSSSFPLRVAFWVGSLILAISLTITFGLFVLRIFAQASISGWTSLILSLWILGGIIIFLIGLASIYLSEIYIEVKQRPLATIKSVRRFH